MNKQPLLILVVLVSRRLNDYQIEYIPEDSESFVYQGTRYELK